jgi:cytochrome P450
MLSGSNPQHAEGFLDAFRDGFNGCGLRIALGPLNFLVPKGSWLKACAKVHQFADVYVERAVNQRDQDSGSKDAEGTKESRTLLHNMAQQTGDRTVLRNQTVQAMMAATETTASLVVHVIRNLAMHPDICTQVRSEVLGSDSDVLTFDRLQRNKSLQNVITESKSKLIQWNHIYIC